MTNIEKIDEILSHIKKVEENCTKLGKRLIGSGRVELGIELIVNGRKHDLSKFNKFEFENLFPEEVLFERALDTHRFTNPHHPEYWNSIHEMPEIAIAEMVCDCTARSSEFGTDIRDWFLNKATGIYHFQENDPIGQQIKYFLGLLLSPKFERVK